jgi:hypothetical protein
MNLKKIGKVFTSKFVGTGPSSYKKIIYLAAISQRLRNAVLDNVEKYYTAGKVTDDIIIWRCALHAG